MQLDFIRQVGINVGQVQTGLTLVVDRECAIQGDSSQRFTQVHRSTGSEFGVAIQDCDFGQRKIGDAFDSHRVGDDGDAVAGDGIQLRARARVTVRTNLKQLVGGATEETVIARVGQGIVQAIGSNSNYASVLENPDAISKLTAGI